jgi:hypothetical protein
MIAGLSVHAMSSTQALSPAEPVKTSVASNGLVADFFVPSDVNGRLPAVVVLGGSNGGLDPATARIAQSIAEHGYATLQLAYFNAPGLPKDLGLIPLEYFKTAIAWLRNQPGVDPDHIGIVGGSIGAEVALTVASHFREIKVAVAAMPSNVVWPGIVHSKGDPPSTFTLDGQPLPYLPYAGPFTTVFNLYANGLKALDQHQEAIIPVERINGPVMLICGKSDTLWPSCPMAEQAAARLKARHFLHPVQLREYPDAGHAVFGQPWDPKSAQFADLAKEGGTPDGNQRARIDSSRRAMGFLDSALKRE